jgi:WD40 repeat protein
MPSSVPSAVRWQADAGDFVRDLAWSPAGYTIALAAANGDVLALDASTGAVTWQDAGRHEGGAVAVAWSADGSALASGGLDGTVAIRHNADNRTIRLAGRQWVEHIAWSPSAPLLAASAGRTVTVYGPDGGVVQRYADAPSTVAALAWRPDGALLAIAHYGGVTFVEPTKAAPVRSAKWKGSILSLAWHPRGRYLAGGCQDNTVHIFVTASGEDLQMSGYPVKPVRLSWDSDGRWLATDGAESATVWDFRGRGPAGSTPVVVRGHEALLSDVSFQRHSRTLASADRDGVIVISTIEQPAARLRWRHSIGRPVSRLAWRPVAQQLAVGTEDGQCALIEVPS